MNLRQLKYVVQLAEASSFSQLAEKLNVSQPALSKHIKSIEDQIGVKLFNRDTTPLKLTPAGEYFVQEARELIYQEEQLLHSMEKFKTGEAGSLTIGISPFRSMCLIPDILKKVKDKYPDVKIILRESNSDNLRKEVAEGKFDFAILNLPIDDSVLDFIPIKTDVMVLAVPNSLVDRISSDKTKVSDTIDFKDCKNLPFVTLSKSQELRKMLDKLCAAADFQPIIAAEINGGVATARAAMYAGIGATILPLQFLETDYVYKDITFFKLNKKFSRQPVIVTKRGQYISHYAQYAIDLLTETKSLG